MHAALPVARPTPRAHPRPLETHANVTLARRPHHEPMPASGREDDLPDGAATGEPLMGDAHLVE